MARAASVDIDQAATKPTDNHTDHCPPPSRRVGLALDVTLNAIPFTLTGEAFSHRLQLKTIVHGTYNVVVKLPSSVQIHSSDRCFNGPSFTADISDEEQDSSLSPSELWMCTLGYMSFTVMYDRIDICP